MKRIIVEKSLPYIMAIARDGKGFIQDTYLDFDDVSAPVGSIFKGRVMDLFEEQGYGFVDVGLERNAYLSLSKIPQGLSLKKGLEILVQVERTPYLEKGSVVSAIVEYASPHLILTSFFKGIRLSRELGDAEHKALKALLSPLVPKGAGLMVRTSASEVPHEALLEMMQNIIERKFNCEKQLHNKSEPCVYKALTGIEKWLEVLSMDVQAIEVSEGDLELLKNISPLLMEKVHVAPQKIGPLFEEYQLEGLWSKLTERRVPIENGAEIVIDETEAFSIIDINSERYIHLQKTEAFAFTVNTSCCAEIARQIRLRNLSGAVLIDFIDMETEAQRKSVIETLKKSLLGDLESVRILGFTSLGILELTRRRRRPSLLQLIGDMNTRVQSPAHSVYAVRRELLRIRKHLSTEQVTIHAAEETMVWIKRYLPQLEKEFSITLRLEIDLNLPFGYRLTLK